MTDKEKCDWLFDKLGNIHLVDNTSWDKMREFIAEAENLARKADTSIYNNDLDIYYKRTWKPSKKNFEFVRSELRSAILSMRRYLPD